MSRLIDGAPRVPRRNPLPVAPSLIRRCLVQRNIPDREILIESRVNPTELVLTSDGCCLLVCCSLTPRQSSGHAERCTDSTRRRRSASHPPPTSPRTLTNIYTHRGCREEHHRHFLNQGIFRRPCKSESYNRFQVPDNHLDRFNTSFRRSPSRQK